MTKAQALDAKREELRSVEAELGKAEAAFDVDAVTTLTTRADTLRRFIVRLEAETVTEREDDAKAKAAAWLDGLKADKKAIKRIEQAREKAKAACDALVEAVREEEAARRDVRMTANAIEVLCRRFELPRPSGGVVEPQQENYLGHVMGACESLMRPSPRAHIEAAMPVSATPEQKRQAVLKGVNAYLRRSRGQLPKAVLAILDLAPIVVTPAPVRTLTPTEQRAAREMAADKATMEATVGLVGASALNGRLL